MSAAAFSREKNPPLREGARVLVRMRGGHTLRGVLVSRSRERIGVRLDGGRVASLLAQDVMALVPLRGHR